MRRPVVLSLALMGLSLLGLACGALIAARHSPEFAQLVDADRRKQFPTFTLQDTQGHRVRLSDYRGKVVLVYFGYSFCPDVCPTELGFLARVVTALGPDAARVVPLFITLDPARDTPAQLAAYTALFDRRLIGLTGDMAHINAAAATFGVAFDRELPAHTDPRYYRINHTSATAIVDPHGQFITTFDAHDTTGQVVRMIQACLER